MEKPLPAIGWREWLALPDFGVDWIKAKVDTGARSSALHIVDLATELDEDGKEWANFQLLPRQRSSLGSVEARLPILCRRLVRSSSGAVEHRPVVLTSAIVAEKKIELELTLTSRDDMGFRMLLGRQAIRHQFIVNPARSYLGAKPTRKIIAQNWQTAKKKTNKNRKSAPHD